MANYNIKILDIADDKHYHTWKHFIETANGATIFHNPDFLKYHKNRFNELHIGIYKGEALHGILPLAIIEDKDQKLAASPYGASYGGFLFQTIPDYKESKDIVTLFVDFIKTTGAKGVKITPPIYPFFNAYSDVFYFSMLEHGFRITNSDITSMVNLLLIDPGNNVFTSRARNMFRKAGKLGIEVTLKDTRLDNFWGLMDKTFARHNRKPTHTFEEWKWLTENLPGSAWFDIAYYQNIPVAGVGHFKINNLCDSSFYLCSDDLHADKQGLSMLVYETLLQAKKEGFKWFDFGTSSVNMVGRENIFKFKESFGATGIFRHNYSFVL